MSDEEMMTWDEVVAHIMRVTGKSKRQATAALLEKCRDGTMPVTGINRATGKRENIPPKAFPSVN